MKHIVDSTHSTTYIVELKNTPPVLAYAKDGHYWYVKTHEPILTYNIVRVTDTNLAIYDARFEEDTIPVRYLIAGSSSLIVIGLIIILVSSIW